MRFEFAKTLMLTTLMFTMCLGQASHTLHADEPTQLGYERWAKPTAKSETRFNRPPEEFQFTSQQKLIDIEVRYSPTEGGYVYDGITQEADSYDGWFINDLTLAQVHKFDKEDIYISDIEHHGDFFGHEEDMRFSIVLRWNPNKFKTKVFAAAAWSEIQPFIDNRKQWRPIDVDVMQTGAEYLDMPREYSEHMNRFNAIFVQNDDNRNFKETLFTTGDRNDVIELADQGFQLIDLEDSLPFLQHYFPNDEYFLIFVRNPGHHFWVQEKLTPDALQTEGGLTWFYEVEARYGPCIDVEGNLYNKDWNPNGFQGVFKIQ